MRLLPGVVGDAASLAEESFAAGLLEYPHYTRPQVWEGRAVPDVLLSGPSRQDRRVAPRAGAGDHEVPAAGSGRDLSAMKPWRTASTRPPPQRDEDAMNLIAELEQEQVDRLTAERPVPDFRPATRCGSTSR